MGRRRNDWRTEDQKAGSGELEGEVSGRDLGARGDSGHKRARGSKGQEVTAVTEGHQDKKRRL